MRPHDPRGGGLDDALKITQKSGTAIKDRPAQAGAKVHGEVMPDSTQFEL